MIGKLCLKITALASVLLLIAFVIIITGINITNYHAATREADKVLDFLSDNRGSFPDKEGLPSISPEYTPPADKEPPPDMSPETPYMSRYFSVLIADGALAEVDVSNIVSVTNEDAESYAFYAMSSDERGFIGDFRYVKHAEDSGVRIVFLDCSMTLDAFYSFFSISIAMSFGGFALLVLGIYFFTGWIVKPIKESYEKQKRFITDAGHEIKTPLAIISANVDLLADELGENECLSDISLETKRLAVLTGELTYLARMEETSIVAQELSFSELALDAVRRVRARASQMSLTLVSDIEEDLFVKGEPQSLEKLLSILLDNAVKYATVDTEISLTLKREGRLAVLCVSNVTGEELDPESLEHIFDRFWRRDSSRSGTNGHGIGLSIAKAIADNHSARISATAKDGIFSITFITSAV